MRRIDLEIRHPNALLRAGIAPVSVRRRILSSYELATEQNRSDGRQWYWAAQEYALGLSDTSGVDIDATAAVIAALSPQLRWRENKRAAHTLLTTGRKESGVLTASFDRANRVLRAIDPVAELNRTGRAPKIHSFARNILGQTDSVTIDTWMARLVFGDVDRIHLLGRVGMYDAIANEFRRVAVDVDETPSALQAIVWIQTRGKAE